MTSNRTSIPKGTHVVISAWRQDDHWDVDVNINDDLVGGGTTPDSPLDVAADILYGDKNDWLNDDHGALSRV